MASNTPQPGTLLAGKYRLLRMLGQGGMGTVFEAEHALTGKHVALKWMHMESSADPEAAQRFVREAQASARLRHPNVVDVYDVECMEHEAFMVMELLVGEPLTAMLARKNINLHEVIALLLPVMGAVARAHDAGVIHRDIKPDNIFLARIDGNEKPVPKVLDFGISKVLGTETLSMTRAGAAMGTPQYMSLEQLYGQADVDARTDIYAFGVMLYEAATAKLPYDAESITELAVKIATTDPSPPDSLRSNLPKGLSDIILRAMAKNRDERYPSMAALAQALTPYANAPSAAHSATAFAATAPLPVASSVTPISQPASSLPPVTSEERPQATADSDPAAAFLRKGRFRALAAVAVVLPLLLAGIAVVTKSPEVSERGIDATDENNPEREGAEAGTTVVASQGIDMPEGKVPEEALGERGQAMAGKSVRAPRSVQERNHVAQTLSAPPAKPTFAAHSNTAQREGNSDTERNAARVDTAEPVARATPTARPTAASTSNRLTAPVSLAQRTSPINSGAQQPLPARAGLPTGAPVSITGQVDPGSTTRMATPTSRSAPVARRPSAVTTPANLPYRNVSALKAAYRSHRVTRSAYKDQVRALKIWRKQQITQVRRELDSGRISRAAYDAQIDAINRAYKGG